jgi:arylformamidase
MVEKLVSSNMTEWIDVSVPLTTGMAHWPGDPVPRLKRALDMNRGDICNATTLSISAHTGTHMDAPLHFIADGEAIDRIPLQAVIGEARVIEIADPVRITSEELASHAPKRGERLLFKTVNSTDCWNTPDFVKRFVHVGADAARYLADCDVRTIGIDYLSIGAFEGDGVETHRILLGAGIWIIEGLNLSSVSAGRYELICLPLKIMGGDGAPARAVVRRLE